MIREVVINLCDRKSVMIIDAQRYTIREIATILGVCVFTVHGILKEDGMSKACAGWMPCFLTEYDTACLLRCSSEFVKQYKQEGEAFLDQIKTMDETWLWHYDPDTKGDSVVWKIPNSTPPRNAQVQ